MGAVIIGAKIGQRHERTGIAVVEREKRDDGLHFIARHLERLPAGKSYPESAARLAEVIAGAREKGQGQAVTVWADVTGLGEPVIRLLAASGVKARPVYFTHGDRREVMQSGGVTLGKAWLVSGLQVLLLAGQLHLPETGEAKALAKELQDYEIKMEPDANERYGAFSVGAHDELVTALGLTIQGSDRVVLTAGMVW